MGSMGVIGIIRRELENCGKNGRPTRYRVAQETGISEAQLHRLINGGSLKGETIGTLLEYFGYEIRKKGRAKR